MKNDEAPMIYLTKSDPARNMSRFYLLDIQPTLFGEWALLREWGRIGRDGQSRRALFHRQAEAEATLGRELKRRDRRGYERLTCQRPPASNPL
jgi:predicted DNA-binding WGR domain protein